ncbi:hypothetical protein Tco_1237004 [Tanacetum coccineum]
MQTQEDHSNPIPALNVDSLNVDSLNVDLVVIHNTCFEKEESNLETASSKSVKECSLTSETKDVHAIKYRCTRIEHGFKRAFMSLFGQDVDTFTRTMLLNVDQLQKQLDKDEFQEDGSMTAFWVMQTQESKIDTGKALDADLVDTESIRTDSTVQDDNSRSGNDTDADDADIRTIMTKRQMAENLGVATLRKENETLKQHYKDLYDSIKITRSKTTEQTTSLLANNAELKAQIQEKVFAIAALKNDLRKLKGNSVDTKFDKTSVLGKPVLPSLRNQSVVRQPNAFKSERAQMSKQRFASQVDVNKNLSKPVTQHYLPKKTESAFAKPDHVIASSSSRNSSKNMPRFSSNDMVHNHYLDEARKKTQERDRNSKLGDALARFQRNADVANQTLGENLIKHLGVCRSYALSWKPCQGDSLNLPDHRAQVDQESQIKMIQVKEMMQDNDLKNSKSKDKGSRSRSQSMNEQSHYKQDKTITRQSINVKRHIFNVIGDTEKFEERDLNIGGDC